MNNDKNYIELYEKTILKYEELADKYNTITDKYIEEKNKNQELFESYNKEKKLNDELISEMKRITENTSTISNNYVQLFKEYSELVPLKKNGIIVEWDNDESTRKFIPILGSLEEIEFGKKPTKIYYTFLPSNLQDWFSKIGFIMKEDKAKLKILKEYGELDGEPDA
jgi:seryl-tRNA synthetase